MFLWIIVAALHVTTSVAVEVPKYTMNDGRQIPAFALGTWLGNNTQGRIRPQDEYRKVQLAVEWAIDAGYRHIDTAYVYGTETEIGGAIANKIKEGVVRREDLFITTKLWNTAHEQDSVEPALKRSLRSLGLDYVDLYLIHWPIAQRDSQKYYDADYVDTWRGMVRVREMGLAKSIGVSNFNEKQMDRIREVLTPAVLQVELNLNLQQPALLSYCRKHNIKVMGYTPFGSLFHHKAKEDAPPPRVDDEQLVAMAGRYNKTVTQVALRYLVEIGVIPIPKSLTKSRIEENVDIFDFKLSDEDKAVLKSYDKNYRTIPQLKWYDHPDYPFEKVKTKKTEA